MIMGLIVWNISGDMVFSNLDATQITIRNLDQALTTYAAKHKGKYPSSSEGLAATKEFLPNEEVPTDAWGNPFLYFSPGLHGQHPYEIISLGQDGVEGGKGFAADIKSWEMDK